MQRLFSPSTFLDFGPDRLDPHGKSALLRQAVGTRAASLRRQIRETFPRTPGVYGMVDEHGDLIYVGKAKNLRARLLSYFRPKSRDPKAGRILAHTRAIVCELSHCEFGALHRELDLIQRWRPRFNVQGQPRRRTYGYVCLGRGPAPYVFVDGRPPKKVLASFGPLRSGPRLAEALRRVNDWFQLRDCPQAQEMVFADQAELFPVLRGAGCLRHEIGTCLGPCAGACSRRAYGTRVRQARAFLAGTDPSPLQVLERDMTAAANAQAYERAAILRDRLEGMRWLHEKLDRLRQAQSAGAQVYQVVAHHGKRLWYVLHGGRTVAVLTAPDSRDTRCLAAARIAEVCRRDRSSGGNPTLDHLDGVLLVAAWFRKHPEEQARVLPATAVLADCWRGAKRQVAATWGDLR